MKINLPLSPNLLFVSHKIFVVNMSPHESVSIDVGNNRDENKIVTSAKLVICES
jgi:hypothetical protein